MPFPIPANDPGPAPYVLPPDNIRSDTLTALLSRDRFIFATSRRCLFKCCGRVAAAGAPAIVHVGYAETSSIVTGKVWIVATGYDCTVAIQIGANVQSITLGSGFAAYSALKVGWVSASAAFPYAVSLGAGPGRLYGLAVYEERLPEAALP